MALKELATPVKLFSVLLSSFLNPFGPSDNERVGIFNLSIGKVLKDWHPTSRLAFSFNVISLSFFIAFLPI